MPNPCVLFDLDGTLCDNTHRQHFVQQRPKDWKSFFMGIPRDKPVASVVRVLRHFVDQKLDLIYVTARPLWTKDMTETWIKHVLQSPFRAAYYRQNNDFRRDDIVKREILGQIRNDGWEPWLVFDDRASVVKMFREEGLTVFQVADGDF